MQGTIERRREAARPVDMTDIRNRVDEALNRLGAQLIARVSDVKPGDADAERDPVTRELQDKVATFGQIAAGLAIIDAECLPAVGAGYGSTVSVRDLDTSEPDHYTLMVGSLVDIDTQQVSLASPIGQALLGRREGDVTTVITPHKRSRLLITKVVTLINKLGEV